MGAKTKPNDSRFSFTLFNRPTKTGASVLYVRIIDKQTGQVLAQRSTGTDNERDAGAVAGRLLAELPLDALVHAHLRCLYTRSAFFHQAVRGGTRSSKVLLHPALPPFEAARAAHVAAVQIANGILFRTQ